MSPRRDNPRRDNQPTNQPTKQRKIELLSKPESRNNKTEKSGENSQTGNGEGGALTEPTFYVCLPIFFTWQNYSEVLKHVLQK